MLQGTPKEATSVIKSKGKVWMQKTDKARRLRKWEPHIGKAGYEIQGKDSG